MKNESELLNRFKSISETTTTVQCAFTQEKTLSFMDQTMKSSGNLYVLGGDKLRWEYNEPYNYAILMVDDELIIIDEGDVNKTKLGKNPAFKKVQQLMTNTLQGDFMTQKSMFDQSIEMNDKFYRISLTPKEEELKEFVSKMDIYFLKSNFMLHKFILDEYGDITTTTFSNQIINEEIPHGVFTWN